MVGERRQVIVILANCIDSEEKWQSWSLKIKVIFSLADSQENVMRKVVVWRSYRWTLGSKLNQVPICIFFFLDILLR